MQYVARAFAMVVMLIVVAPNGTERASAAQIGTEPTFIARSDSWVSDVQTDGDYVVWTAMVLDPELGERIGDVYVASIADGTVSAFATGTQEQVVCDIDGNLLAWYEQPVPSLGQPGYVHVTDLATQESITVDTDWCIGVSDGTLAYVGDDGNIWLRAFGADTANLEVDSEYAIAWAAFQHGWLAWAESTPSVPSDPYDTHKRMVAKSVGSDEQVVLDEGWGNPYVSLSGSRALTSNLHDRPDHGILTDDFLIVTDLTTGVAEQFPVPENCWALADAGPRYATLYCPLGDWATDDMVALDLDSRSIFPLDVVDRNPYTRGGAYELAAGDDILVWAERRSEDETLILATDWSTILPTAPVADAREPGSSDTWFPETGHHLSGTFKAFWDNSGGLPVFGYSLTEPYTEQNDDTAAFTSVQWFERQRYELHPENAGTPYEVLLGRLGVELLAVQGRNWTTLCCCGGLARSC